MDQTMTRLPSGLRVGITNLRARYHATRRNLKIDRDTPPADLLELVDIVVAPEEGESPLFTPGYRFSGHTLADFPNLADWDEEDLELFLHWMEESGQYRQIEEARRRVVWDDLPLQVHQYHYPDMLYSALEQRLKSLPQGKASVSQWQGTLQNMGKSGLRQEELLWSGLENHLDSLPADATITRQELIDRMDFTPIRLEVTNELVGGGSCGLQFEEIVQNIPAQELENKGYDLGKDERSVIRFRDPGYHYRIGLIPTIGQWFVLDPAGNPVGSDCSFSPHWFSHRASATEAAHQHASEHFDLSFDTRPCSRYEHKSLCGGEDYREWLISMPEFPGSFFSSHYYERNLLLHCRTKIREDEAGRRLLFIEELQSDWHQSGAMHGYTSRWPGSIPMAPFRSEWVGLALKILLLHVAEHNLDGISWTNGREQELHYGTEIKRMQRLYDQEIPHFLKRIGRPWELEVERTTIATKEPRLHALKEAGHWKVLDPAGVFKTRPRYSHQEAIQLIARHCRSVELSVPFCLLSSEMKKHLRQHGLPMFGEQHLRVETL